MSKLIGTNPNQVPTNADLGTMAYMDYDAVAPVLIGGRRNMLINGDMKVWQRGESITNIYSTQYTADRWRIGEGSQTVFSAEKTTDAPTGFGQSYKLTVTTPDTVADASNYAEFVYSIEGQDCQALGHGTAGARDAILSFWVKSSVAGNYATYYYKDDTGRGMYSNYTVNNANTWEYKTIVIPADASGAINNDNGNGLRLYWTLMTGSNYNTGTAPRGVWGTYSSPNIGAGGEAGTELCATSGATWQITGVQLELGSVATPFEHRSYGEELALCQRYYQYYSKGSYTKNTLIVGYNSTTCYGPFRYLPMRAAPTATITGAMVLVGVGWQGGTHNITYATKEGHCSYNVTNLSGVSGNGAYNVSHNIALDAEL
jgi:hypothetical protein